MLPLVGDLAPPKRRAASLSVVTSGLMLGILGARVISGTMTNFLTWRAVYWLALGLQYFVFVLLWWFMPDYPRTNTDMNYFRILLDMIKMLFRHPVLVQACLTGMLTSAPFSSFWTTLTFLLAGKPYNFPSLTIGLFGLIGIAAMLVSPVYASLVTDRFVPHFSVLFGLFCSLTGIVLGTYVGTFSVAGPILQALFIDFGFQTVQIANRSSIYSIEPKRRNGVNTVFMVTSYCGQLLGTAAGNHIYAAAGWTGSGSASVGFVILGILVMIARGPWEERWVGWRGGWAMSKADPISVDGVVAGQKDSGCGDIKDEEMGCEKKIVSEPAATMERQERLQSEKAVDK